MLFRRYGKFFFGYGKFSVFCRKRIVRRRKSAYINNNIIFAHVAILGIISCKLNGSADICRSRRFAFYHSADCIAVGNGSGTVDDFMIVCRYGKCAGGDSKRGGFATFGEHVVFVSNARSGGIGAYVYCRRAAYIFACYSYGKI